jgi:hypothetical protein
LIPFGSEGFFFPSVSRNVMIKIFKTTILAVVMHGYETWYLTLMEDHTLRVFKNRVLRRIFGPKRDEVTRKWIKLHSEEIQNLCSSPSIVRQI